MNVTDYLNLIPSSNFNQPDFVATLSTNIGILVQIQSLMTQMQGPLFDIDTPPVGDQLDIIGQWVGISRDVDIPIPGVIFTWDDTSADGWDYGVWQGGSETEITVLPDDVYLTVILAKIAANHWDGTTNGAYTIWNQLFSGLGFTILIQDYLNMSYAVGFVGAIIDSLTQALIVGGYFQLRPEGIEITQYFFPVNTGPIFGWDLDNSLIQGWDYGSWAAETFPS